MTEKRCNVAAFASGYGSNFEAICEACREGDFPARVVCLLSDNPDARAHEVARSYDIPSYTVDPATKKASLAPETERELTAICERYEADLIVLAGFMRILKGPLFERFDGRIMNIHPSLLPSFKGLDGIKQAYDYGVKVAGCTVHFVDRSVDGGPIILQATVPVEESDTLESLTERVHKEEHRIYVNAVERFARDELEIDGRRVRAKG